MYPPLKAQGFTHNKYISYFVSFVATKNNKKATWERESISCGSHFEDTGHSGGERIEAQMWGDCHIASNQEAERWTQMLIRFSFLPFLFSLGTQPMFRAVLLSSVNSLETLIVTPKCTSQGVPNLVKLTIKISHHSRCLKSTWISEEVNQNGE